MPPAGFEPTLQASERPQAHALDRAATGLCCCVNSLESKIMDVVSGNDEDKH